MLYVPNNGETCKDQLCQHPECWQSNVRRVRAAVRRRNGIREDQNVNKQTTERFDDKKRQVLKSHSLPTLKIVDMTEDLVTPYNDNDKILVLDSQVEKGKQLHSSRPPQSRPTCLSSFRAQVPHTTPISPSLPEKHANRWKEKLDSFNENNVDEKMTKINFHEIYDYNEVCQDWQDMFISTAYLVWCPSKKKKRKKETRSSSAVSENKTGFKNPIEVVLPLPPESNRKKPPTSSKVPTGGQPYSPCRSPVSRMYNVRHEDYISDGEYIMDLAKEDIPRSLMASKKILEQKPNTARKDEQLTELKKSSSTKVLIDISATLATPGENSNRNVENEEKSTVQPNQLPKCERLRKRKARFLKRASDFESRKMLSLPSIAIPWSIIPDSGRRRHCKNSIPHCVDLDVIMEPVLYIPRTVSSGRSRVRADVGGREKGLKDRPRTGPTNETFEERNHLTSAYRLSPKNVGTPAPTPATPGTRESRRRRSGLRRANTKDSLSRTRLDGVSEVQDYALDGEIPAVRSGCSKAQSEHAILEVAESNIETLESLGNELSKLSLSLNNTDEERSQRHIEAQSSGLDKVPESESAMSDRAISPSSRTNIPTDIWAELRSGGGFDHRRITPQSNLDVRNSERPRGLFRGYHSSLGLSIYSYSSESNWKPHPPRLPKAFTYMGVYKPTILPKMPAALTVVPVPSATRPSHLADGREVKVRLSKVRSIRIPPVPAGSPVPNMDITTEDNVSTVDDDSTELFKQTGNSVEESQSLETLTQDEASKERISIPEEASQEREYLISREVIQETGVELPQGSEDQNAGTDVSRQESHDAAVNEETLQDLMNSDKYTLEDTLRLLDVLAGETDELMGTLPSVTCTKSDVTCPKPDVTRPTSEKSLMKVEAKTVEGEDTGASMDEKHSKKEITCNKDEDTCNKDEITCSKDEITCTKVEITCSKVEITCSKVETTCSKVETTCVEEETTGLSDGVTCTNDKITGSDNNVASGKDEFTCPDDKITCPDDKITCPDDKVTCPDNEVTSTKDKSTCFADDSTCTKDDIPCETREETIATRDNTAVGIEIDENCTHSTYEIIEESTDKNNAESEFPKEKENLVSPVKQTLSHKSSLTKDIQGSFRSLVFPQNDARSILSDISLIPKVPSDFELVPYDVESELLLPIKIDSDLLLLNDDSFTDLTLDDDRIKTDDDEVQNNDTCTK